jgi:hypothetical protein
VEPMNRQEYFEFHQALCDEALELSKRKNADYAGADGNHPFANFTRCENMGVCTTEKGFLVRLTDKMSRLSTFSETGQFMVADESFRDTLIDVVNYVCLLGAYVEAKKNERHR